MAATVYEFMPSVPVPAEEAERLCKRYTWLAAVAGANRYRGECGEHASSVWSVGPGHWMLTAMHSKVKQTGRGQTTFQFDIVHPTHCGTFKRLCRTIDDLVGSS